VFGVNVGGENPLKELGGDHGWLRGVVEWVVGRG
jgi:hypothetical protein